jgi:DNA-binding Xre family transcriptional regulator
MEKIPKKFRNLREKMSPEARKRADEKAEKLIEEMPLNELRAARKMTQEKLAENLHMKQAAVSKLERRTDMYVSTLREFINAMGRELEITARFPDGAVRINQFEEDESDTALAAKK